jgi:hypothetical protein
VEVEEEKSGTDPDDMMDEESIYGLGPKIIVIGLVMH